MSSQLSEAHLWNELVDKDNNANSADEATQKWTTKNVIQKTKPEESCSEDDTASHEGYCTSNLCVCSLVVVIGVAFIDVLANDLTGKEGAGCFWPDDHQG
jgi:hypothetical protein